MGLTNKKTLISFCCAATLLDLSESTVRKRLCGTENLTHVRKGNSPRTSLILEEVLQLKSEWIEAATHTSSGSSGKRANNRLKLVA